MNVTEVVLINVDSLLRFGGMPESNLMPVTMATDVSSLVPCPITVPSDVSSSVPIAVANDVSNSVPITVTTDDNSSVPVTVTTDDNSSVPVMVATDISSSVPVMIATKRSILKPLRPGTSLKTMTTNNETIHMEVENEGTKGAATTFERKPSKVFRCEFDGCERSFTWPAHLKYHLLTHTGSREYKCPLKECGKRFYTQQRLNIHLRSHTDDRPFVCSVKGCEKHFTTLGNLKNHVRTHTGERPFGCDVNGCDRKFAELSSLKKHRLVHTGNKPFECDICGQKFSQIGSRNVHKKRKHRNLDYVKHESKNGIEEIECDLLSQSSEQEMADNEEVIVLKRHEHEETKIVLSTDGCQLDLSAEEVELGTNNSLETVVATCDVGHMPNEDLLDEELSCRTNTSRSNANVLVVAEPQPISELTYLSTS